MNKTRQIIINKSPPRYTPTSHLLNVIPARSAKSIAGCRVTLQQQRTRQATFVSPKHLSSFIKQCCRGHQDQHKKSLAEVNRDPPDEHFAQKEKFHKCLVILSELLATFLSEQLDQKDVTVSGQKLEIQEEKPPRQKEAIED